MDFNELKRNAREKFNGACRICPVCNGIACSGEVPGMGALGTGSTFRNNINALAGYRLNMRVVHSVSNPLLTCNILGLNLNLPVIGAAIGGISMNMKTAMSEDEYDSAVTLGCCQAGTIAMTGDGPNPEIFESGINALKAANVKSIPIIKPRENSKIIEMAKRAADAGAPAFGIDLDAAALINMTNAGQTVGPKLKVELEQIKRQTTIPFIIKGIMTRIDAEACYAAGVDAIVVSNHGGRSLDHLPGTAEVLPEIVLAVKGRMTILVDGGIRSGVDVLKMLALGADAVLIGRPLAIGAVGGQSQGVEMIINRIAGELRAAMVLTATPGVDNVSPDIIWRG